MKTTEQQPLNAEGLEQNQQEQAQPSLEQDSSQLEVIPEKFVGKDAATIIKSYQSLEQQFSKVSSERAEDRKVREQLEAKVRELESRPMPQAPAPKTEELPDPISVLENEWSEDPLEATKKALSLSEKKREQERRELLARERISQANAFYEEQKKNNPEFSQLEPIMTKVTQEFGDLLSPEMAQTPKAIRAMYMLAQALERDSYAKSYAEKAQKEQSAIINEKKSVSSTESSSQSGTIGGKKFDEMSEAEMIAFLGRADK